MADNVKSVVEVGRAQRSDGSWPKPGEEGFVHPDGTPQSQSQLDDNLRAAADRAAAGSGVHGAPAQGGVQPGMTARPDESDHAQARREHTEWVREGLVELDADEAKYEASNKPAAESSAS
jgi:hypothetical protein